MNKRTTESIVKPSPEWGELEGWLRGSMQKLIQEVLGPGLRRGRGTYSVLRCGDGLDESELCRVEAGVGWITD